ncbi:MAG: hypothetical protein OEM59_17215 [Rhodospirillales bacterium]|nr:hypothetical protein [Rhodospirillales bacterium]
MRSTISISAIVALALAGAATAQEGPRLGCYARDYTAAHLASHPDQIVGHIVMRVRPDPAGPGTLADLAVWTADQGHVRKAGLGGQRFDQVLICWREGKAAVCGVECDGGLMQVERDDGEVLQFRTDYLLVGGGGCEGLVDLAERPGQAVSYRLSRAPDAACASAFGN